MPSKRRPSKSKGITRPTPGGVKKRGGSTAYQTTSLRNAPVYSTVPFKKPKNMRRWRKRMVKDLTIGAVQGTYLKMSVEDIFDDLHRLMTTKKPGTVLKLLMNEITESGIYQSKRPLVLDATKKTFVTISRLTKVVYDAYASGDLTDVFTTFIIPYAAWVEAALDTRMRNRLSEAETTTFMKIGEWIRSRTPTVAVKATHQFWDVQV